MSCICILVITCNTHYMSYVIHITYITVHVYICLYRWLSIIWYLVVDHAKRVRYGADIVDFSIGFWSAERSCLQMRLEETDETDTRAVG